MTTFNKSHIGRRVKNRLGKKGRVKKILSLADQYPICIDFDNGTKHRVTTEGKDFAADDYANITLIEDDQSNDNTMFVVGDTVMLEDGKTGKVISVGGSGATAVLDVEYDDSREYYTIDGKRHKNSHATVIKLVRRAQDEVKQVWLSDEDKEAYEQRVSDYKLENFLEGFDGVDLWATFIECWADAEMLGFAKRGVIMQELKNHSVENLSKWWAGKFDMHPQHLSDIEVSEIKKSVDDIFL